MRADRASPMGSRLACLRPASWATIALIVAYIVFFGWMAVMRHQTFGSSAMDMGYTDQVVWNTVHGRFMRFTTLENARIDLPLDEFRRTDTLLAYHVELLLVPLSLLYLVWSDPLVLVLVQVVGIALGAWPAHLLARDHLGNAWAGVAFASAYLLAPATQGATISDFHATSLTCALFLWAMYAAHHRRWRTFALSAVLCLLAKEDIAMLVFLLGVWLFLAKRERLAALITSGVALTWFVICNLVILPSYNGLSGSPFLHRLAIFGPTLRDSLAAFAAKPTLLIDWLLQPDIVAYLAGLLASGGFLSLFDPLALAIAAPSVGINVFSTWSWTYSGGEHYSATILPFVIASATYGMGRLLSWADRLRHGRPQWLLGVMCLIMVSISGAQYVHRGIWPLSPRFRAPHVDEHDRIGHAIIGDIPDDASVSAQSNLYPHISQRRQAYFFPAVNEAEYVLLDVSGVSYPLTVDGLYYAARELMRSGEYGVVSGQDGYLLLRRGAPWDPNDAPPQAFYTFCDGSGDKAPNAVSVRFGDALELVGWDYDYLPVVQSHSLPVVVTTWWRPLRELAYDYQPAFFFTQEDGAIVYGYHESTAATIWHPPYQWSLGETIRIETPVLASGGLASVLIGVALPGKDAWQAESRLTIDPASAPLALTADGATLYRAFDLP